MKLQYLGDSRDAFKWDLLHHLCKTSSPPFRHLLFIPLLTPDDQIPRHGKTPHSRFAFQAPIRGFLSQLASSKRDLNLVHALGAIDGTPRFQVSTPPGSRIIQNGAGRASYWKAWPEVRWTDALVFFDPDNGFETKTQKGGKWIRHNEIAAILPALGPEGAVIVYQHRPQRQTWDTVFATLMPRLDYVDWSAAVYEANLGFVILGAAPAMRRITPVAESYANNRERVRFRMLRGSG